MTWQPTSTTTVDDSTAQHLAFPFTLTTQAGTHLATYRAGSGHSVDMNGRVVVSRSADGATWQPPVVLSNCEGDERSAKLAQTDTGVIVAGVWAWRTTQQSSIRSMVRTSTDDGATWSYPSPLPFRHTSWSAVTGLVSLGGEALLAAAYGSDGGSQYVSMSSSNDGGKTWNLGPAITASMGNFQEPAIVRYGADLLCFLRYEYGGNRRIYLSRSSDDGATWTSPTHILGGGGQPAPHVAPDGTILLAYRADDECAWATSGDGGETWTTHGRYVEWLSRWVYGDWITVDGLPVLVSAFEPSTSMSKVYVTPFTQPEPTPEPEPQPAPGLAEASIILPDVQAGDTLPATITVGDATYQGEATIDSYAQGDTVSIGIIASSFPAAAAATYEDEVLADSPTFYYKADETSGTTLVDSSVNGYNGTIGARATIMQAPLVSDGGYSHTISITGTGNTFIPDDGSGTWEMTTAGSFSVEIWAKMTDLSGDNLQVILDKTSLSSSNNQWGIWWDNRSSQGSPQRLRGFLDGISLDWSGAATKTALEAGAHIVLVKSGADAYLYVNGVQRASSLSNSFSFGSNGISVNIGQGGGNNFYAGMTWDWLAWYTSALSSTRVAAHYNAA